MKTTQPIKERALCADGTCRKPYLSRTRLLLFFIIAITTSVSLRAQTDPSARIWVSRSISTDTIFYEGAPDNTTTTVSLRAWASGDSIFTGTPIDVAILTDNSTSMSQRNPGTRDWIPPISRIQGTYNASVNFVDSFMNTNDRIAHLRFCQLVDTPYQFGTNFVRAKQRMDSTIDGRGRINGVNYDGTALWTGILKTIRYVMANRRPGIQPVIIALTDGTDNASGSYGSYWRNWMPNLGTTQTRAVDSVVKVLDSIRLALGTSGIKVFTINLGVTTGSTHMQRIAAAGNGSWAYSATGMDLDSIFQNIGQRLSDVVARSITPGAPVLIDVLGPGIHYVPNSFAYRSGIGFVRPSFLLDTVNGFTRLSFGADTIRLEQFLDIQYQITAAMGKPDIFKDSLMRTNNTHGDAPNYSVLQYKNIEDSVIMRPIERSWVNVRSGIGGLFLSESLFTVVSPSATRLIPLVYSFSTPAVYPSRTLYSILEMQATGTSQLAAVNSQWFFQPNAGWTAPLLNGIQTSAVDIGVTVPYNYSDQDTLTTRFSHRNSVYSDFLVFSASDSSQPEQITGIAIDNDTVQPGFIDPPRMVITGNRTELNSVSIPLFSRAITNRNNAIAHPSIWSIEQFNNPSQYANISTNTPSAQRTLTLNVPVANYSQSDSGIIRITSGLLTFALKLVVFDTTNYDTTDVVAIYDSLYGNYSPYIEAAYSLQMSKTSQIASLGDTVKLYALLFDSNGTAMKYLGDANASWQINGGTPVVGSSLVLTSQTALQTDVITVTYVNEWGRTLRSTYVINWTFGRERHLSIESQIGTFGSKTATLLDSITVQASAIDTIRGIYAVVRDEYGYCIGDFNDSSAVWGFSNSAALTFLSIPSSSMPVSSCWIFKKASPAEYMEFYLVANGLASAGIEDQRDSVKIKLTNYNYSRIEIVAADYFQGFAPGDIIPRNTIVATGCDREVTLYTKAYYNDSLYDVKPVYWSNSAISVLNPEDRYFGVNYAIQPLSFSSLDTIFVNLRTDGGVDMFDTLLFSVDSPYTASVRIDTSRAVPSGVQTVEIVGNISQLRTKVVSMFSYARPSCPAMDETRSFGNWSTSITDGWIQPFINQVSKCSITVQLGAIPATNGNHSLSGTVYFRDGNISSSINLIIRDTTDYDTLECLIPDTTVIPSVATFQDYLSRRTKTEYTMRAGDTLKLRSRFYDINATNVPGVLVPKYVGTDSVRWELRSGAAAPVIVDGGAFRLTQTVSGRADTIVVSYPSALRSALPQSEYPKGAAELTHTIVVNWVPATAHEIRFSVSDVPIVSPLTTDTITLSDSEDTLRLFAVVFDRFGNIVSSADKMTWYTDSANWLEVPSGQTHTGLIVKKNVPDFLATFLVEATLPAGSYLGSGLYSPNHDLKVSVYIQTGDFVIDQLMLVSVSTVSFVTTFGDTVKPGDVVSDGDTLLLRSCDATVAFRAYSHSTNTAVGSNGWSLQSVVWTDPVTTGTKTTYSYTPDNTVSFFDVTADYLTFSTKVYFKILPEYGRYVELLPITPDKRTVIFGDTTRIRQALDTVAARVVTNCGTVIDTMKVLWRMPHAGTQGGFTNPTWWASISSQIESALPSNPRKFLTFTAVLRDTFSQTDSTFIIVTYANNNAPEPDSLRDTIKLVIYDNTDYDTLDVMALVPNAIYRQTADRDGLYNAYSTQARYSVSLTDTLRMSPLLYDINTDGMKYLGNGRISGRDYSTRWYINGTRQWTQVDSVCVLASATIRRDTVVAVTVGSNSVAIVSDTIIVEWVPGSGRILHLENTPGASNVAAAIITDTLVMAGSMNADTVYGVIRDLYGNFVSNMPVTRWTMTPAGYYNYLQIPPSNLPTNEGVLHKIASPSETMVFAFIGRIERNTLIEGVATGMVVMDTVYVRLVNYDYTAVDVRASSQNIKDTSGNEIAEGNTIPSASVIDLIALEDSVVVRAMLLRDDTLAWESQSVTWRVSGNSLYNNTLPVSGSATLNPRRQTSLDTLFAMRTNGNSQVLTDTVLFRVQPSFVDSYIVIYNPNPGAGDTVTITIIAIDKAGDTVTYPSRLPDTFPVINPGSTIVTDTGTPFPGGTVISIVPIITGNDTIVIAIPVPRPDGTIDTLRDTIFINTNPSRPDSIAIVRIGGNDTLLTAGNDLSVSTATIEIRIFDQYGNMIPPNSPVYDSILVTMGGVLDSTDTVRTNRNSFTVNVQNNTSSGSGFLAVTIEGYGSLISDTLSLFVSAAVQVLYVSTHEWLPDTTNVNEIRDVIQNVLNLDPDSIANAAPTGMSGKSAWLSALANGGFQPVRDGYLDYLVVRFSDPVFMDADFVTSIEFRAGVQHRADTEWKLSDSASGRSIHFEPVGIAVGGKHALWRLWLVTNGTAGSQAALETGYLPTVTFSNTRIRTSGLAANPDLIGDGRSSYTVPVEKVRDSAAPVLSKVLFRNNACDKANPNNALVVTFSEPVQTSLVPGISTITSLSLNDGSGYDSLFIREIALSGGRIDFIEDSRLAWNYADNPDRMMAWQILVDRNMDARLRVGKSKVRFSLSTTNRQISDLTGNLACASPAKSVTIMGDVANSSYLCSVSGLNEVNRDDARFFSWSATSENGKEFPLFPYFGFSVNLDVIGGKTPLQQIGGEFTVGTKNYVLMDIDSTLTLVYSEVRIFDLIGNMVADPSSHSHLRNSYTVATIRQYLDMQPVDIQSLNAAQIESGFDVYPASNAWEPDTLVPKYPATLPIDFEFMARNCGKGSTPCIPAWNCYNFKGRLVAPGGYIAVQKIATPAGRQELTRRLIVKGKGNVSGLR